jgi:acyl carrier protein
MDTLAKLNEVFRDVFEDEDLTVGRETTAKDVAGWDSVMHITLMMSIERAFKLRFNSGEVANLKNVGALADLIARKLA